MSGPWQPIRVNAILGFFSEYQFMSNFYPSQVIYECVAYPTVEHAFQAAKTLDEQLRRWIASRKRPGEAKKEGRNLQLRKDWESVKYNIMKELVTLKFKAHADLRQKLLDTGDKYLEETNTWGDTTRGVCRGKGTNWLGKILMEVRADMRDNSK
jgi:N-glycosidase YbiA